VLDLVFLGASPSATSTTFYRITEKAWEIIGTLKKLKTLDVTWSELSGIPIANC